MLVEKSRAEAIKAFLSGRKVNVLTEFEDGSMAVKSIEAILSEEDTRYLVDVPAVEDPEFRQAVEDMVQESDPENEEDTGLTPPEIMELKERDEAMEINEIHVDEYYCPACGTENNCDQGVVEDNFCPRCGRRLKRRED